MFVWKVIIPSFNIRYYENSILYNCTFDLLFL